MIETGKYNRLIAHRKSDHGIYLRDGEGNEVLLPNASVPETLKVDDEVEVFVYTDSEDRPIATHLHPYITLHQFAFLKAVQVNKYGAFMDWGLTKDLLVPFSEQQHRIKQGKWYVTYLFFDEKSGRLVGSTRIDHFLKSSDIQYTPGDEVDLLLYDQTALGYKVIINNKHQGLIFRNEVFKNLEPGYQARGFIKKVRDDGKIDVSLNRFGYRNIAPNTELIMKYLRGHDGYLDLNDNSKPEEIISRLEMSKKTFKKAIGDLYKRRLIRIERDGIYLI